MGHHHIGEQQVDRRGICLGHAAASRPLVVSITVYPQPRRTRAANVRRVASSSTSKMVSAPGTNSCTVALVAVSWRVEGSAMRGKAIRTVVP